MPADPLLTRAARVASLSKGEREALIEELIAEVERVTAERDKVIDFTAAHWLPIQTSTYTRNEHGSSTEVTYWWVHDGAIWHVGESPREAVCKAVGLDGEGDRAKEGRERE